MLKSSLLVQRGNFLRLFFGPLWPTIPLLSGHILDTAIALEKACVVLLSRSSLALAQKFIPRDSHAPKSIFIINNQAAAVALSYGRDYTYIWVQRSGRDAYAADFHRYTPQKENREFVVTTQSLFPDIQGYRRLRVLSKAYMGACIGWWSNCQGP